MIFSFMPFVDVEARKAYQRRWYSKHKKDERLRGQRRYWSNRDKESLRKQVFYKKNRALVLKRTRAYVVNNPTRVRKYRAQYFQKNKERIYEYRRARPWIHRAAITKRRARIFDSPASFTEQIAKWEKKWRRAKSVRCYWCDAKVSGRKAHLDHITPLSRGGSHSPDNVCVSCGNCNQSKCARSVTQFNKQLNTPKLEL